jgi:hypothetical protein
VGEVGSGNGVDSIQAREGSPAENEGKKRRLMSSGVPVPRGPSEVIDDGAAKVSALGVTTSKCSPEALAGLIEPGAGHTGMSSPDGGRSASGFLRGDGGADS